MKDPHPTPRPIRRTGRLCAGAFAATLALPLIAWFAAILLSIVYSGVVIAHDSSSRVYRVWLASQSTVVRTGKTLPGGIGRSPDRIMWYAAHDIATGHTYADSPAPDIFEAELSHTIIVPILALGILLLALVARRCFFPGHGPHSCAKCGYSTIGLRDGTCPECGSPLTSSPQRGVGL